MGYGSTIIIAIYLHASQDKFRASIDMAQFLVVGGMANQIPTWTLALLENEAIIARLGATRAANLSRFVKLGKNPAIAFTLVMVVMFCGQETIQDISKWIDTKTPDGAIKQEFTTLLSLVTGEAGVGYIWE